MKIVGVLLLSSIPVFWGIGQNIYLNRRTTLLSDIMQIIMTTKEMIRFSKIEIDKLFSFLLSQSGFSRDSKFLIDKVMKKRDYKDIFKSLKEITPNLLKDNEVLLLAEFFSYLGKSDVKGQMELCDFYFTEFQRIKIREDGVKIEKSRLKLGLSLSLGAGIFIILI
jgi:hypothetical protein